MADLKVRGLAMRYRRAGLGAPLAASVKPPEQSPRVSKVTATGEVFNLKTYRVSRATKTAGPRGAMPTPVSLTETAPDPSVCIA